MFDLGDDNKTQKQCKYVTGNCTDDQQVANRFHVFVHIFAMNKFVDQQHNNCIEDCQTSQYAHTEHEGVCYVLFKEVEQGNHHDGKGGQHGVNRKVVLNTFVLFNQVEGCNRNKDVCGQYKQKHDKAQFAGSRRNFAFFQDVRLNLKGQQCLNNSGNKIDQRSRYCSHIERLCCKVKCSKKDDKENCKGDTCCKGGRFILGKAAQLSFPFSFQVTCVAVVIHGKQVPP